MIKQIAPQIKGQVKKGNMLKIQKQRHQAFTLIELMVVVAIIAILATLSVSNFSSATKRTRNSQRVSDIQTVAKALETCYDISTASYGFSTSGGTDSSLVSIAAGATSATGPFSKSNNSCLNTDIVPKGGKDYYYMRNAASPQTYILCAELEQAGGWETVGTNKDKPSSIAIPSNKCTATSGTCYFCVVNAQ